MVICSAPILQHSNVHFSNARAQVRASETDCETRPRKSDLLSVLLNWSLYPYFTSTRSTVSIYIYLFDWGLDILQLSFNFFVHNIHKTVRVFYGKQTNHWPQEVKECNNIFHTVLNIVYLDFKAVLWICVNLFPLYRESITLTSLQRSTFPIWASWGKKHVPQYIQSQNIICVVIKDVFLHHTLSVTWIW